MDECSRIGLYNCERSVAFSDFVQGVMNGAKRRYTYQTEHPREVMPKAEPPPDHLRRYSSRTCVLLMPASPSEVNRRLIQDVDEMAALSVVAVMDEVMQYVAPGGQADIKEVAAAIRQPGTAPTAEEIGQMIRDWMHARKRATSLGITQLSCVEELHALEAIIQPMERLSLISRTGCAR